MNTHNSLKQKGGEGMRIETPERQIKGITENKELAEAVFRCAEALEYIARKMFEAESVSLEKNKSEGSDNE